MDINLTGGVNLLPYFGRIDKCPVCDSKMNELWHSANGYLQRISFHMSLFNSEDRLKNHKNLRNFKKYARPSWTNCCHCCHHDCQSNNCFDYHKTKE